MRYAASLTIPAGTLASDPATEAVALCYGTIIEIEVLFPAGHSGLTHLQIWYHEHQIIPTSPGESLVGDDHLIEFPERYPVHEEPWAVMLVGWAPESTLEHTIYVGISVETAMLVEAGISIPVTLPGMGP